MSTPRARHRSERGEASIRTIILGCLAGMAALIAAAVLLAAFTPFRLSGYFVGGISASLMTLLVLALLGRKVERLDPVVAQQVQTVQSEVAAERRRLPDRRETGADTDSLHAAERALDQAVRALSFRGERRAAELLRQLPELTSGWDPTAELTRRTRALSDAADEITAVMDRSERTLRNRPKLHRRVRSSRDDARPGGDS